ncbi:hypothetical protein ADUPG1_008457, partial [Aduncisulcus paluster]
MKFLSPSMFPILLSVVFVISSDSRNDSLSMSAQKLWGMIVSVSDAIFKEISVDLVNILFYLGRKDIHLAIQTHRRIATNPHIISLMKGKCSLYFKHLETKYSEFIDFKYDIDDYMTHLSSIQPLSRISEIGNDPNYFNFLLFLVFYPSVALSAENMTISINLFHILGWIEYDPSSRVHETVLTGLERFNWKKMLEFMGDRNLFNFFSCLGDHELQNLSPSLPLSACFSKTINVIHRLSLLEQLLIRSIGGNVFFSTFSSQLTSVMCRPEYSTTLSPSLVGTVGSASSSFTSLCSYFSSFRFQEALVIFAQTSEIIDESTGKVIGIHHCKKVDPLKWNESGRSLGLEQAQKIKTATGALIVELKDREKDSDKEEDKEGEEKEGENGKEEEKKWVSLRSSVFQKEDVSFDFYFKIKQSYFRQVFTMCVLCQSLITRGHTESFTNILPRIQKNDTDLVYLFIHNCIGLLKRALFLVENKGTLDDFESFKGIDLPFPVRTLSKPSRLGTYLSLDNYNIMGVPHVIWVHLFASVWKLIGSSKFLLYKLFGKDIISDVLFLFRISCLNTFDPFREGLKSSSILIPDDYKMYILCLSLVRALPNVCISLNGDDDTKFKLPPLISSSSDSNPTVSSLSVKSYSLLTLVRLAKPEVIDGGDVSRLIEWMCRSPKADLDIVEISEYLGYIKLILEAELFRFNSNKNTKIDIIEKDDQFRYSYSQIMFILSICYSVLTYMISIDKNHPRSIALITTILSIVSHIVRIEKVVDSLTPPSGVSLTLESFHQEIVLVYFDLCFVHTLLLNDNSFKDMVKIACVYLPMESSQGLLGVFMKKFNQNEMMGTHKDSGKRKDALFLSNILEMKFKLFVHFMKRREDSHRKIVSKRGTDPSNFCSKVVPLRNIYEPAIYDYSHDIVKRRPLSNRFSTVGEGVKWLKDSIIDKIKTINKMTHENREKALKTIREAQEKEGDDVEENELVYDSLYAQDEDSDEISSRASGSVAGSECDISMMSCELFEIPVSFHYLEMDVIVSYLISFFFLRKRSSMMSPALIGTMVTYILESSHRVELIRWLEKNIKSSFQASAWTAALCYNSDDFAQSAMSGVSSNLVQVIVNGKTGPKELIEQ